MRISCPSGPTAMRSVFQLRRQDGGSLRCFVDAAAADLTGAARLPAAVVDHGCRAMTLCSAQLKAVENLVGGLEHFIWECHHPN